MRENDTDTRVDWDGFISALVYESDHPVPEPRGAPIPSHGWKLDDSARARARHICALARRVISDDTALLPPEMAKSYHAKLRRVFPLVMREITRDFNRIRSAMIKSHGIDSVEVALFTARFWTRWATLAAAGAAVLYLPQTIRRRESALEAVAWLERLIPAPRMLEFPTRA